MDGVTISESGSVTYSGLDATKLYQAKVIKSALRMFIQTGLKANKAYTLKNMIDTVNSITGKNFASRQKHEALEHITGWIAETEKKIRFTDERITVEA